YLCTILAFFKEKRILLSGKKTFLGYPSIKLFGYRVNGFGISITEEYIAAIK
ncbi:uncharacterized protein K444DRAFT_505284, partial [Hyaloscypha bicolor E]